MEKIKQFAVCCNIRLEILDKLEQAEKEKNQNDILKYRQQLEFIEKIIKELQKGGK